MLSSRYTNTITFLMIPFPYLEHKVVFIVITGGEENINLTSMLAPGWDQQTHEAPQMPAKP